MQRIGSLPFLSGTDMALPFARSKLCLWFPSNALAYARASDAIPLGYTFSWAWKNKNALVKGRVSKHQSEGSCFWGAIVCSMEGERRLLLGELSLRGAVR